MAHIVTLKDNNDEISYPITPVDAVFVDSNTTLADALDDKADADLSNVASGAITGAKIASNTVTASNIDLTTLVEVVGSTSAPVNYALKYADGTMVAIIKKTATVSPTTTWGSLYQTSYSGSNLAFAAEFYSAPVVSVSTESAQTLIVGYEGSATTAHAQSLTLARPQSASNISTVINVTAIGRWKA